MYIKLSESSSNKSSTGFPRQASDPLGLAPSGAGTTPWSRVVRHQPAELGEVDLPVPVHVRLGDHVPHLGLGQRLAQVGHGQPELLLGDEAVAVPVEDPASNILRSTLGVRGVGDFVSTCCRDFYFIAAN